MEPRSALQRWPSGEAPSRAWTKTIDGAAYTVKRLDGDLFGIWRGVEELGTFELKLYGEDQPQATYADDLSLEARTVVGEFIRTSLEVPEGAAKRGD